MMMRFKTEIRDVPEVEIARHLGLNHAEFVKKKPGLLARGFPEPDPDTGNYDLHAVNRWQDGRHPRLFVGDTMQAQDASVVAKGRIA